MRTLLFAMCLIATPVCAEPVDRAAVLAAINALPAVSAPPVTPPASGGNVLDARNLSVITPKTYRRLGSVINMQCLSPCVSMSAQYGKIVGSSYIPPAQRTADKVFFVQSNGLIDVYDIFLY